MEAGRLLRLAAEQGHAEAQWDLGLKHRNGFRVQKDLVEAIRLFRRAAEQGHAKALAILARSYEAGEGVEKNLYEALKLYQRAGENGVAVKRQMARVQRVQQEEQQYNKALRIKSL